MNFCLFIFLIKINICLLKFHIFLLVIIINHFTPLIKIQLVLENCIYHIYTYFSYISVTNLSNMISLIKMNIRMSAFFIISKKKIF
jgi:hypothetical protein